MSFIPSMSYLGLLQNVSASSKVAGFAFPPQLLGFCRLQFAKTKTRGITHCVPSLFMGLLIIIIIIEIQSDRSLFYKSIITGNKKNKMCACACVKQQSLIIFAVTVIIIIIIINMTEVKQATNFTDKHLIR